MKIPEDEDFEAMRRIAETCGEIAKSRGWHEGRPLRQDQPQRGLRL